MPDIQPIGASGRFDRKRPRPIPKNVQEAISLMVVGKVDDPACEPLDFVQAAAAVGLRAFVLRRHLEKPHVRAHLLAERRTFLAMACAANESALMKVRDTAENSMSRVAAVRQLEAMHEETSVRPAGSASPGVVIVVRNVTAPPPMVDVTPRPALPQRNDLQSDAD
jgi:hypothetical protein